MMLLTAFKTAVLIVPIAGTFKSSNEKTRKRLGYYTLALVALLGLGLITGLNDPTSRAFDGFFILGWVAFTWVAAYMITRE